LINKNFRRKVKEQQAWRREQRAEVAVKYTVQIVRGVNRTDSEV